MYNMKTTEFEQFGLCNFFRTFVLKHAELAKEELNWITTSVPRAHHTCVAAGWIPGHWIHNAPTSSRFCVGIILKKGQRLPTISILWNMIAKQFTLKPRVEVQEIVTATTRAVELAELHQLPKTSWKLA
jgi:hypothetical protein